jgi:hypothetical protein
MARTKFVLNERRLALLEARRQAAARAEMGEDTIEAPPLVLKANLSEELRDI